MIGVHGFKLNIDLVLGQVLGILKSVVKLGQVPCGIAAKEY
jgi:hypothetical protein